MAAIFLAQHQLRANRPPRRRLNVAEDTTEENFIKNYRLGFNDFDALCNMIRDDEPFNRQQGGPRPLTVEQQVATTLRFLASGTFQNVIGDVTHISQSS